MLSVSFDELLLKYLSKWSVCKKQVAFDLLVETVVILLENWLVWLMYGCVKSMFYSFRKVWFVKDHIDFFDITKTNISLNITQQMILLCTFDKNALFSNSITKLLYFQTLSVLLRSC